MKDMLHQTINIGDIVVFNPPTYKGIIIGKITKLTEKGCTIKYSDSLCNRCHSDVIKIDEQYQSAVNENPEFFI